MIVTYPEGNILRNSRRTKAASLLLFAGLIVLGAACDDDGATDTTDGTTAGTTDTAGTTTAGDESPAADTTTDS